eukprot:PITA_03313
MEGHGAGSSTPSYKQVVSSQGKKPMEEVRSLVDEGKESREEEQEGVKYHENKSTKETEDNDKEKGAKTKASKGPCKPKSKIWIKYHWKPKRSIDLHMGSKGLFTVVFTNIEDKDRLFEGGPYFYVIVGLYMRLWMMNFILEWETFTSVLVWVRIYSLPLDYWQTESLTTIGNKLGHFVKASEASRRGKYNSFARICVEMDLSRALLDELILEVFDEEWVQTINYEHIHFRCRRCHGHGHLFRDFPLSKIENKIKTSTMKDTESFQKLRHKGKGGKRGLKQYQEEGP